MITPQAFIRFFTLTLWLTASPVVADQQLQLQKVPAPDSIDAEVIIDTRPVSSCRLATLSGAICVPVEDIVAPQRRLANWSGILWLLGTAGLNGSEHVMVVGEKSDRRDLLAAVLFVAGQKQVSVVDQPVSDFLSGTQQTSAGIQRSTTRVQVFTAPMRSKFIVLSNELRNLITGNAVILDGRTEAEYFGTTIRAQRGGHIPGAIHSPVKEWRSTSNPAFSTDHNPVVYAHDSVSGLQYFSTVKAAGLSVRLYLGGWVEWAADASLSVDSVSYPDHRTLKQATSTTSETAKNISKESQIIPVLNSKFLLLTTVFGIALLGSGFFVGRRFSTGENN